MRLDKILADAGHGSRKELRAAIKQGRVTVDSTAVYDPSASADPKNQMILLDGADIDWQESYTLMLHKPLGVVSSTDEPGEKTVIDLLPERYKSLGLFPVGRLDKNTTGLLLLTNDGNLCHMLTSPARHVDKCYLVTTEGAITEEHCRAFESGIILGDGTRCKPAELSVLLSGAESRAIVTLREGKYHQVRRMMAACSLYVLALHRISIGPLKLDEALFPGNWRKLTKSELLLLDQK